MNKKFLALSTILLLLSACTSRHNDMVKPVKAKKVYSKPHLSNVNDVDISDLDVNLNESETMMSEYTETSKMKRNAFPVSEYYALPKIGKGTIKGKIYLSNAYGNHIVGAETRLYLNPVTSYSTQWYKKGYLAGHKMEKADTRLFNYLKFTSADSAGSFDFYGVPNGSYYLIGTVKCGQECGFQSPTNIRLARKVSVYGNQIVQQDLTRAIR